MLAAVVFFALAAGALALPARTFFAGALAFFTGAAAVGFLVVADLIPAAAAAAVFEGGLEF